MRPVSLAQSALGQTAWIIADRLQASFGIGLGCRISSGASLTYKVQHSFSNPYDNRRVVTIARSTTVATVTDVGHSLSVGDSIIVTGSGSSNLDGTYDIASIVDADSYTYTVANSGAAASAANTYLASLRVFDHPTLTGQTASADGNYQFPVFAVRLKVTTYASGNVTLQYHQGQ